MHFSCNFLRETCCYYLSALRKTYIVFSVLVKRAIRSYFLPSRCKINGFDFLGKVITGVKFRDGIEETTEKTGEVTTNNQVAA